LTPRGGRVGLGQNRCCKAAIQIFINDGRLGVSLRTALVICIFVTIWLSSL